MNNPKISEMLERETLIALRDKALSFAKTIDDAVKIMESHPLASYNLKSGLSGIDRLVAFEDALSQSILLYKTGRPLDAGQLKNRSSAKKKNPPSTKKRKALKPPAGLKAAEKRNKH